MERLKSLRLSVTRLILKIFYIFPLNEEKVLFISFDGRQYSCNPKYIFKYITDDKELQIKPVWVFNKPKEYEELQRKGVTVVKNKTVKFLYHMLTAKVIITNASIGSYLPLRKSQNFIETWHGGGAYKKTGRVYQQSMFKDKTLRTIADEITGFISSSKKFTETKSQNHLVPREKFWEIGMPRNDVLFDSSYEKDLRQKVREFYEIDKDTRIAMYAPTLRNDKSDTSSFESLNTEKLVEALKERFGGEKWVIFFRLHYLLNPETNLKHTLNVSTYNDSQELLCATDVLLSDYSSMMWDFSFTERPIFVFAPDADKYKKERAFFTPMEKWPYPVAFTNDQLVERIKNFDENHFKEEVEKHHIIQGSFESGTASKFVVDRIRDMVTINSTER